MTFSLGDPHTTSAFNHSVCSIPPPNCFRKDRMTPSLLRQLWSLVETTQTQLLLNLDDDSLAQWLMRQLGSQQALNYAEKDVINDYIQSHLPLIRDLAQSRLIPC